MDSKVQGLETSVLRVLITNDDGINAEGIRQLALLLSQRCDVTVVAPDSQASATSHSITLHKPLRLKPVRNMGYSSAPGLTLKTFQCNGTPADCVMLGILQVCKDNPPHLVISGVNNGINVAQDLTYSGTVGGALEGAVLGIPSIAVSLDRRSGPGYANAAIMFEALMCSLLYSCLPDAFPRFDDESTSIDPANTPPNLWNTPSRRFSPDEKYPEPGIWYPSDLETIPCLNVNLPDKAPQQTKGVCWTFGGERKYTDIIREAIDPKGRKYYWIGGEKEMDQLEPGGDTYALHHNFISVTPMTWDITSKPDINRLSQHFRERTHDNGGH